MEVINQITAVIESVEGVKLLDVDPGAATNRTVVTFVGEPDNVIEAAFLAVKRAAEVIDMRGHHGEHPRMGAPDVCPLVPVSGVTMEECVEYARKLAKRIGEELAIPVYCYESAAYIPERKNLAVCRTEEYEGLSKRVGEGRWKPDFGPNEFNDRVALTGATAVGARDFLVAINYNLNTTSTRRANSIAFDVREKGRKKREGDPIVGKVVKDENGEPAPVYSVASGLDYPSSGPEHAFLHDLGRVKYDVINDDETIDAFFTLSKLEGIIPAIESSHAVAYGIKLAQKMSKGSVLINLSGRGDKDMDYVIENYGIR